MCDLGKLRIMDDQAVQHISPYADLPVALSSMSAWELRKSPKLCALLVEYSCLELELGDWYSRQPKRSNGNEFRRWIADGRQIFDRRDEIKKTARRYRSAVVAATPPTPCRLEQW